jgi:hypothetical protein
MKPLSIQQRAEMYNSTFPHLPPLVVNQRDEKPLLYGAWFLGGARHSDFYGSYHNEYLTRLNSMFPDAESVVHLFSGSLPPGKYTRVGIDPTGKGTTADIIGNAEQLSSFLPFRPDIIYADPPYSVEDCDHYKIGLVNRAKVVDECGTILQPGGYLVWLDQALPVFSNKVLNLVGLISYIRSTGNRFRVVTIFKKPANVK